MLSLRHLIVTAGMLVFAGIGFQWANTYSLWDDEANTALFAQSVNKTGDTSAVLDHNVIAYRHGAELNENQKARYVSPLQYYFLAPFIDPDQPSPLRARLPFLIVSLLSLALIYRRLLKRSVETPMLAAFSALSLGLVSFLLFGIQSRYYALTFLFALLMGDQYFFGSLRSSRDFIRFGFWSALLFISNYLVGVAALTSLGIHYLWIRRGKVSDAWKILLPHLFISLPVFLIWNPLGKNVVELKNTPLDKLNLLFRNFRDFNGGHLGSLAILFAGLFLFGQDSKKRFREYLLLLVVYLFVISALSPQPVRATGQADIRYLYPLMLLSFGWTLDFLQSILHKNRLLFGIAILFFALSSLPYSGENRFHLAELFQELRHPASDPYAKVAQELRKRSLATKEHPSVYTSLDYATYPLMYAAPSFRYLQGEKEAPDYVVDFCDGTPVLHFENTYSVHYQMIASIPSPCREAYRPEVFLRSFGKGQTLGNIQIFKKNP